MGVASERELHENRSEKESKMGVRSEDCFFTAHVATPSNEIFSPFWPTDEYVALKKIEKG